MKIKVKQIAERKFMIWVNENYIRTYNKTITNIKLRSFGVAGV